ncbi:MAG: phosphotransferase [Ectothiorhodospiraceae bacterium]|nr:phosphotransferase [Ectothiorhodospiraceae bacterium]
MNDFNAPTVTADAPDAGYLAAALNRAGRAFDRSREIHVEALTGGRTGAGVYRLKDAGRTSYVLKRIPRNRAIREALGHEGEGLAWLRNITRAPPPPLINPTLDVAINTHRDEWWLLMEDVSAGIQSRGEWVEAHSRRLFEAIADLHAAWWEVGERGLEGVGSLAGTTGVLVEVASYVGTGRDGAPWVARVGEEFPVPGILLPDFLEAAGPDNARFYLELLESWPQLVERLNAHPATLLHGDLRRANIAFVDGQVVLFDWEFAATGPAATDLAWHWFLHYWAYPPDDGRTVEDRLWLREAYLARLEQCLGRAVNRGDFLATWDLGWLRVFCQLGFVLADGLDDDREARQAVIEQAFEEAHRIADERLA